jgi:hypothetical protein
MVSVGQQHQQTNGVYRSADVDILDSEINAGILNSLGVDSGDVVAGDEMPLADLSTPDEDAADMDVQTAEDDSI